MRVLIADDDPVLRHALKARLEQWKYEAVVCRDGIEARTAFTKEPAPSLAIIDWEMPGVDGTDLCRELRTAPGSANPYVILLTGKETREDVIFGLESGCDDYLKKPVDWDELRARLAIGVRTVVLQEALAARVAELQEALANVRKLSGLLPICAYCKRIRNDKDYWQQIEHFVGEHSEAQFSHSICPECLDEKHPEFRG
jgi:sigma-B regulation protein RsbU (phosphoserine phosphatase)